MNTKLASYVAPDKQASVRQMSPQEIQQYTAPSVVVVEQAFSAQEGADERTSGMDRSWAFLLRLAPLAGLWLILGGVCAAVLVMVARMDEPIAALVGLVVFVGLSYLSYAGADSRERYDSRHGVEHHRIDSATYLAEKKLESDEAIRRQLVTAYLKQLEGPRHE